MSWHPMADPTVACFSDARPSDPEFPLLRIGGGFGEITTRYRTMAATAAVRPLCWRFSQLGTLSSSGHLVPRRLPLSEEILIERRPGLR